MWIWFKTLMFDFQVNPLLKRRHAALRDMRDNLFYRRIAYHPIRRRFVIRARRAFRTDAVLWWSLLAALWVGVAWVQLALRHPHEGFEVGLFVLVVVAVLIVMGLFISRNVSEGLGDVVHCKRPPAALDQQLYLSRLDGSDFYFALLAEKARMPPIGSLALFGLAGIGILTSIWSNMSIVEALLLGALLFGMIMILLVALYFHTIAVSQNRVIERTTYSLNLYVTPPRGHPDHPRFANRFTGPKGDSSQQIAAGIFLARLLMWRLATGSFLGCERIRYQDLNAAILEERATEG